VQTNEYELSYIQKKNCLTVSEIFVLSTLPLPGSKPTGCQRSRVVLLAHNNTLKRQKPGKKPCGSEKSNMGCRALEDERLLNSYINSGLIFFFDRTCPV